MWICVFVILVKLKFFKNLVWGNICKLLGIIFLCKKGKNIKF